MVRPIGDRDWWMWWCVDNPESCRGVDYCLRLSGDNALPTHCPLCGKEIPEENKQEMTLGEVEEHGCEGGVE